ncbi:unnamed protein product [Closterium sp. Naga37s-1]|nr:unnamed protein product [Closterium sp. Naga37s-1]
MSTLYVMKVNCNGVLRRISSRCSPPSFRHVSLQIFASLDIPASKPISLTYTDTDGDVIHGRSAALSLALRTDLSLVFRTDLSLVFRTGC